MSDILTESTDGILRVQLNRPAQKNGMTSSMYTNLADILNECRARCSSNALAVTAFAQEFDLVRRGEL